VGNTRISSPAGSGNSASTPKSFPRRLTRRFKELNAGYKGIILSGGPSSVYDPGAPTCDPSLFQIGLPVLGLCYGHQLLSRSLGGEVNAEKSTSLGRPSCVQT